MDPQRDEAKNAGDKKATGRVIVTLNANMDLDLKQIPISAYHALFPALGLPIRDTAPSKRKKHDRAARSDKLEAPHRETMGITIGDDSINLDGKYQLKENAGRLLNALLGEYDIKNLTVTDGRTDIYVRDNKQWLMDTCQDRCRRYIVRNISFAGSMYYDQIRMFMNSCKGLESITLENIRTFLAIQATAENTTCIIKKVSKTTGAFDLFNLVKYFGRAPNIISGYTLVLLFKNGATKFKDAVPSYVPSEFSLRKYKCILSKTRWLNVTEEFGIESRCIVRVFDRDETPYTSKKINWV